MAKPPVNSVPLNGITLKGAVSALCEDRGFVAIDLPFAGSGKKRFTIVSSRPKSCFSMAGGFITIDGHVTIDSPIEALRRFTESSRKIAEDPQLPFSGGIIGYIGFEAAKALLGFAPAEGFSRLPQCMLGFYDSFLLFDHVENTVRAVSSSENDISITALSDRARIASAAWQIPSRSQASNIDFRLFPKDSSFDRIAKNAFEWLRSEALERFHLVRHAERPAPGMRLRDFICSGSKSSINFSFTHEGAACEFCSSENIAFYEDETHGIGDVISKFPAPSATGVPRSAAIACIEAEENTHRTFYGGGFGTISGKTSSFWTISSSSSFMDGTIRTTAGADILADSHPATVKKIMDEKLLGV